MTTKSAVILINGCALTLDIFKSVSLLTVALLCITLYIPLWRIPELTLSALSNSSAHWFINCSYTHGSFQTISVHWCLMKIIYHCSAGQCCKRITRSLVFMHRIKHSFHSCGHERKGMKEDTKDCKMDDGSGCCKWFVFSLSWLWTESTSCLSAGSHDGSLQ